MSYYSVYDEFVSKLGLRGGELNVYSVIYNAVAHLNGYISISQIRRRTGISETRVCEVLKKLEDRGLISRASVGHRRKNRYELRGVRVGSDGYPKICINGEEFTSSEIGDDRNLTDQNYFDNGRTTSAKRMLPIVNKL